MNTLYEKCIELIEQGRFEEASSHVREMRLVLDESSDNELGLLQRLLSVRISLKARGQDENEELPDPRGIDGLATWIAAEMAFVRGLCCYQRSDFQKGRGEFLFASTQYGNSGNIKRSLLSRYNALIGSFNLGEAAHNKAPDELVEEIRLLKREAMEAGDHKTLGLVARQYSLVLKDQGKFLAALAEAKKSVDLLEIYAAASDYHLALVNAADCALALNDRTQACTYLDYLPPELDLRVEYPRAVMLEALQIPGPEPDSCRVKCFHYEGRRAYYRSRVPSRLAAAPLTRPYSLEGLEGELVSLLRKKPQSKELLQERLWPGASHTNQLDNRLHRLVSRVRKKCPISFERGLYSLRNDQ